MNTFTTTKMGSSAARGFTLPEVLIAFIIMSYGMLGIAYMHTQSVQFGYDSKKRSEINSIVADMADRMRANGVAATDDDSSNYTDSLAKVDLDTVTVDNCQTVGGVENKADTVCFYYRLRDEVSTTTNFKIETISLYGDDTKEGYRITVYWSDQQLVLGDKDNSTKGPIKQAACTGEDQQWSGGLAWPDPDVGDPGLCLRAQSWQFEVFAQS